jgi:hypothetical protein
MKFNLYIVVYVAVIGALAIVATSRALRNAIEKTCVYLFITAHAFYSGVGIARANTDDIYLVHYTVFMLCLVVGIRFGMFLYRSPGRAGISGAMEVELTQIARIGTLIYFGVQLLGLVYTNNLIPNFFRVVINIEDIFERKIAYKSDMITYLIFTAKVLLLPLVYIHMSRMKSSIRIVLLLIAILYIEIVQLGYIGRSGLLSQLFVLSGCVIIHRSDRWIGRVKEGRRVDVSAADARMWKGIRRLILVAIVCLILGMPLLQDFTAYRMGQASDSNTTDSIRNLLAVETGFPNHYSFCEEYHGNSESAVHFSPGRYMSWIATLPLPKFTSSPLGAVNINYRFSELRTGNLYGTPYFHVALPSLLGEGLLMYGSHFFWVHGLFLGFLIAVVIRFLSSVRSLRFWAVYIALSIVLMARGGSQGAISVIVNYSLIVWLFLVIVFVRRHAKAIWAEIRKARAEAQ